VIGVDLLVLGDRDWIVLVVRDGHDAGPERRSAGRVRPAQLARHHERENAGEVRLISERRAGRTLASHVRRTSPAPPTGASGNREAGRRLLLRPVDAPLDLTNVIEVLTESGPVAGTEAVLEMAHALRDGIENAGVLFHTGETVFSRLPPPPSIRFDKPPRGLTLHGKRRRRRLPRDRVHVGAACSRPRTPDETGRSSVASSMEGN